MKKKKPITKCPKCGSSCLWYKPGGAILCTVCMTIIDKEGSVCQKPQSKQSGK